MADCPALFDSDIRRLDVAVNDPFGVSGVQSIGNFNGQPQQNIELDRFSRDAMLQRHPVEKLHGDKRSAMLVVNLIYRADIGMVQCGSGLRLALKAAEGLWVLGDIVGQEFERYKAVEFNILGLVDHTHAAAQLLD